MRKTIFRLPGGTKTTTSYKSYTRAWGKIIRPLEKLTGFKVTALDPGINLCKMRLLPNGKTAYDCSVCIPVFFAQAILDGVKNKEVA
jgi:hypothetical protein